MSGGGGGSPAGAAMKQILTFCLLVLGGGVLLVTVFTTKQIAFYYPYEDDLEIFYQSPGYVYTRAQCREWAREQAREIEAPREGYYTCGKKCTYIEDDRYFDCRRLPSVLPLYNTNYTQTVSELING